MIDYILINPKYENQTIENMTFQLSIRYKIVYYDYSDNTIKTYINENEDPTTSFLDYVDTWGAKAAVVFSHNPYTILSLV